MIDKIKNNQIVLSIIGVLALMMLLTGITYAGFSKTSSGGNNSISSGTITMSFQEPSNNVVITNAMPISGTGYSSTTHFDFSVTGTAKAQMTIPYEISITEKTGNTLSSSNVKIGLKKNGTVVTGFITGILASDLTSSTIRSGSKILIKDTLTLTQSGSNYTAVDNYQLFLWIKESAVTPNDGSTQSYAVTVNINSNVGALSNTRESYVVTMQRLYIGSTLPNGVIERSTPELAIADWENSIGTSRVTNPFYLKEVLNGNDEIEESYIGFIINDTLKEQWKSQFCSGDPTCEATYNNLVNGTYSLRGGDNGVSFISNKEIMKAAFNYDVQPSVCSGNSVSLVCSVSAFLISVNEIGNVVASDYDQNQCHVDSNYSFCNDNNL